MKCIICDSKMDTAFSLGTQPLANKYPKDVQSTTFEIKEDLVGWYCTSCKYVHAACDVDRAVFFEDYYYLSSVNAELVAHFSTLADIVVARGAKVVVDVGSNDGIFLKPLIERGVACLGIDPSENVAAIANDQGCPTLVGFYDFSAVEKIKETIGAPDLICASSVFTHFENPHEFFEVSKALVAANGELVIEVEYLADIISQISFERFYFDRPHYYSLTAIQALAKKYEFEINHVELISPHGGSLRVFISRRGERPISNSVDQVIRAEKAQLSLAAINSAFIDFDAACKKLVAVIGEIRSKGLSYCAYGCPARFSTITNFASLNTDLIPFVIDDGSLKQNRLSPGMHIPIVPFQIAPKVDVYIVFAYEYIESIKSRVDDNAASFYRPIPWSKI